ncbi:MAG: type IV fimbrial biogenesis protein FimT [Gammaproteobacteria bacterium]|jgi:type IV fimbrial biogenesis protein FimT
MSPQRDLPQLRPPVPVGQVSVTHGFSLVELLTVVAIAAILAAVALPNMQEFLKNNARSTRLNDLTAAINFTRSQAITNPLRRSTTFCASTNGTTCAGTNFGGFVLVLQANVATPAAPDVTAGDWTRIRTFSGTSSSTVAFTGSDNSVVFLPTGLQAVTATSQFVHCDARGATSARAISLSVTGHPAISSDTNSDGTHNDNDGNELTCPAL